MQLLGALLSGSRTTPRLLACSGERKKTIALIYQDPAITELVSGPAGKTCFNDKNITLASSNFKHSVSLSALSCRGSKNFSVDGVRTMLWLISRILTFVLFYKITERVPKSKQYALFYNVTMEGRGRYIRVVMMLENQGPQMLGFRQGFYCICNSQFCVLVLQKWLPKLYNL